MVQSEETQFEGLIEGLLTQSFGSCDQFLEPEVLVGLRHNLMAYYTAGLMHPAGVGRNFDFQHNTEIRGDVIRWLEPDTKEHFERIFLDKVARFIAYLNQTCYTGINACEFHYACYEENSFYKRHLDQFRSDKGRKFSLVLYLNADWQSEDGGDLSLYVGEKEYRLSPLAGRVVFFRSDETEHEVHPAPLRRRMSIAGWLKRV